MSNGLGTSHLPFFLSFSCVLRASVIPFNCKPPPGSLACFHRRRARGRRSTPPPPPSLPTRKPLYPISSFSDREETRSLRSSLGRNPRRDSSICGKSAFCEMFRQRSQIAYLSPKLFEMSSDLHISLHRHAGRGGGMRGGGGCAAVAAARAPRRRRRAAAGRTKDARAFVEPWIYKPPELRALMRIAGGGDGDRGCL